MCWVVWCGACYVWIPYVGLGSRRAVEGVEYRDAGALWLGFA